MSYEAEHLGVWYSVNTGVSSTVTSMTFTDGNNTNTTAPTNYRWNVLQIFYEIVTSTNGQINFVDTGASPNTFAQMGGTGSASSTGYRSITFPSRGIPSSASGKGITATIAGTILCNFIVVATLEKIA